MINFVIYLLKNNLCDVLQIKRYCAIYMSKKKYKKTKHAKKATTVEPLYKQLFRAEISYNIGRVA